MRNIKQVNIKNRTRYVFDDMINIKGFDPSVIKIDKKSYENIGIYNIKYITIKSISDCKNINSVNLLHLTIGEVNGYIEESNENKYLRFPLLINTKSFWMKSNIISKQKMQTNLVNMRNIL